MNKPSLPLLAIALVLPLLVCMGNVATAQNADAVVNSDFGLSDEPKPKQLEPQQIIYHGAPISITMSAGQERRIVFDGAFEIGIDSKLTPEDQAAFRPQIFGNNLLLTVDHPLALRVIANVAGESVPIDLAVVEEASDHYPVAIVRKSVIEAEQRLNAEIEPPIVPTSALHYPGKAKPPGYVDLVRFAAQKMYAPKRYQKDLKAAKPVDVDPAPVRLMRFDAVETKAIGTWKFGELFVTAVEVTNKHARPINLDPRLLIGRWNAASFHHNRLGPVGSRFDRTMLYLVSTKTFDDALGVYRKVAANKKDTDVDMSQGGRR